MLTESFDQAPLTQVILSYLYQEYQDDEDLQAFVNSFNSISQGYLDWFISTPLSVYTSPNISGPLLDWAGRGLYNVSRPVISNLTSRSYGSYNTAPFDTLAFNARAKVTSGSSSLANDDLYKRSLTWHTYLGDGRQMSIMWLRRRVARFLYGVDGGDIPDISLLNTVSITRASTGYTGAMGSAPYNTQSYNSRATKKNLAARSLLIRVPSGVISSQFKSIFDGGFLATPFQVKISVLIGS
jgi:hypothetical protein